MAKYYKMAAPSRFFCTKCGQENMITIARKKGQEREVGHLKKLYCFFCKEEINHAEIKENNINYTYEDFLEEFNSGRFVEGERVSINSLFNCSKKDCPFNKNGRCWNADNSEKCKHKPE